MKKRNRKDTSRKKALSRRPVKTRTPAKRSARKNTASLKASGAALPSHPSAERPGASGPSLPSHYGDDRIVLMVRDPWWLFTYWELTSLRQDETLRRLRASGDEPAGRVLRVYDVYGVTVPHAHSFFDIEVGPYSDNWYIDVGRPDSEWVVEIGFRTVSGKFFAMARSNAVRTPRYGISNDLDEEWMIPDDLFWKLMGRTLGSDAHSSLAVKKGLKLHLRGLVSSERPEKTARTPQA